MNWTTTDEIVKELRLESTPDDFESLKRELRLRLASCHPDKTGGAFSSKDDETQFNTVAAAYEFVNQASRESRALIPVTQLPAIIKAVRDAQLAPSGPSTSQLRSECRVESRLTARSQYSFQRIGSGVFAAICVFLFTFSGSLAEHPILSPLAKNSFAQLGLLSLAGVAGLFFVMTWIGEKRQEARVEWLMSGNGRRELFEELINETHDHTSPSKPRRFTSRNLVDLILWRSPRCHSNPYGNLFEILSLEPRVSLSLAEKIAEIHIPELEKRNAIRRVDDPSIDAVYEINEQVLPKATRD